MTDDTTTQSSVFRGPRPSPDADAVLDHLGPGTNVIVPLAAGEPVPVIDAIERAADRLERVTVHQMHGLHDRPFLHGRHRGRLDYVSYFLSPVTRKAFHEGTCDLVPCHFSEVPALLRRLPDPKLVVAAASPMDRHGYFSLGTNADYVAAFIGQIPFFLEANAQMPRTFGRNQIHVSQTVGWTEADYPIFESVPVAPNEIDRRIATLVAERIPDGATIQAGIGSIPNAVFETLTGHRDLGIHTELLSDGVIDLVDSGVVTGTRKVRRPTKVVATFALGTRRLYDFLHENAADRAPARRLCQRPAGHRFGAALRVHQRHPRGRSPRASRLRDAQRPVLQRLGRTSRLRPGRDVLRGRAGLHRPALHDEGRDGVAHHESAAGGLRRHDVEEHRRQRGHRARHRRAPRTPRRERARSLISIAHPKFRDELTAQAHALGYL